MQYIYIWSYCEIVKVFTQGQLLKNHWQKQHAIRGMQEGTAVPISHEGDHNCVDMRMKMTQVLHSCRVRVATCRLHVHTGVLTHFCAHHTWTAGRTYASHSEYIRLRNETRKQLIHASLCILRVQPSIPPRPRHVRQDVITNCTRWNDDRGNITNDNPPPRSSYHVPSAFIISDITHKIKQAILKWLCNLVKPRPKVCQCRITKANACFSCKYSQSWPGDKFWIR